MRYSHERTLLHTVSVPSGVIEFGLDERVVKAKPERVRLSDVRCDFVPFSLTFPAWVVMNGTRTGHLHLSNTLAAFETDCFGYEHLVKGNAYLFTLDSHVECVVRKDGSPWWGEALRPGYQMEWNPEVSGYHKKASESYGGPRHRWDLHGYRGGKIASAVPCGHKLVRDFGGLRRHVDVTLWDRSRGRPVIQLPWGFLSVIADGRRVL
jgi:hypothetical protein